MYLHKIRVRVNLQTIRVPLERLTRVQRLQRPLRQKDDNFGRWSEVCVIL